MSSPTELPDLAKLEAEALECLKTFQYVLAEPEKHLALILLARRAQPEGEDRYTVDHRELAGKILSFSGISSRGSLEPGADPLADRLAEKLAGWGVKLGQPEGEAPQAEPVYSYRMKMADGSFCCWRDCTKEHAEHVSHEAFKDGFEVRRLFEHPPAATLSPLCCAQHAEFKWPEHPTGGRSNIRSWNAGHERGWNEAITAVKKSLAQQAAAPNKT